MTRTKAAWILVVPFLVLARPTAMLIGIAAASGAVGLLIRAWAAGTIEKGESLAVSGPYAFTRNPLYLGSFLIGLGLATAGGHWMWPLGFLAFFAAVYVPTIRREAEVLAVRFGSRYTEYADHVPAFLPRLPPHRAEGATGGGFRWSRYLRYREWEALLGVAAVLAVLALKI